MKKVTMCLLAVSFIFTACQDEGITTNSLETQSVDISKQQLTKININFDGLDSKRSARIKNESDASIRNWMNTLNEAISDQGIFLEKVEMLGAEEVGRTVFFKNLGNKQLSSDFVPNDPRHLFPGTDVPYWIDGIELGTSSGMTADETESSIISTMDTWDAVSCSEGLGLTNLGTTSGDDFGDIGLIQFFEGFGGSPFVVEGGIAHAGIISSEFFEAIGGPGGGSGILGVTFTLSYCDPCDGPDFAFTDLDQNGKADVGIKEIYINDNDNFNWQDAPNDMLFDADGVIDFETVVLHEVGHGLSQGHFGTAFRDSGQGYLHFSPAALMNAGYTVARRDISLTDEAGHCSNWGGWPND